MTNATSATMAAQAANPQSTRTEIKTHHDEKYQLVWCYMQGRPRPCFSPDLLHDMNDWCDELQNRQADGGDREIRYHVLASNVPGVFNLGGDLALFRALIQRRDREGLVDYARTCIDLLYSNIAHFYQDITTLALVQGDALGGGFEAALASDVLIAERGAKLGFPEILFNLFPGMGAYSLLARKIGGALAERLILSGQIHTAEALHEMGVVDVLTEAGQGEMAVYDYIRRENRSANGYRALRAARRCIDSISYEELIQVTEIWVDAALRLQRRDLRMMELLVAGQNMRQPDQTPVANLPTEPAQAVGSH